MSEDQALIKMEGDQPLTKWSEDDFTKVSSGGWLGRIQLMTAGSDQCKRGEFPQNHYAYIQDQNFQDLGETVDVLCVTWRPKAMDMNGDEVVSVFDPNNPEFKRIQDQASVPNSMCMFGSEFLIWLPQIKKFATFFMGTASARRESPNMMSRLQKAATLDSKFIDPPKSQYSWQAPVIKPCTTPFDLPEQEELIAEVEKFNNPSTPDVELAEEGTERAR